jgi:hypothetical protein
VGTAEGSAVGTGVAVGEGGAGVRVAEGSAVVVGVAVAVGGSAVAVGVGSTGVASSRTRVGVTVDVSATFRVGSRTTVPARDTETGIVAVAGNMALYSLSGGFWGLIAANTIEESRHAPRTPLSSHSKGLRITGSGLGLGR